MQSILKALKLTFCKVFDKRYIFVAYLPINNVGTYMTNDMSTLCQLCCAISLILFDASNSTSLIKILVMETG